MNQVILNKTARKQLKKLPRHIVANLRAWINEVETVGVNETRIVIEVIEVNKHDY